MIKKIDLIDKSESWLIRDDFKDEYFRMSASQMNKQDINLYIKGTFAEIEGKGNNSDLKRFCQLLKDNFCRGIDKDLKKKIIRLASN